MNLITTGLFCLFLTCILLKIFVPVLQRKKANQTILFYVKEHKHKNGTPTMGGVFFVLAIVLGYFLLGETSGIATVSLVFACAFFSVGFLDDFIKVKTAKNEGLKPYQKIIFQILIGLLAGFFAIKNRLTFFYLPFFSVTIDLGLFTMPFIAVVFIAITNCVNLTDGLDGLASSVSVICVIGIAIIVYIQSHFFGEVYPISEETSSIIRLSACAVGALIGFLCFNVNKANIFMGDTGSLFLGGLIGALTVFTGNTLLLPIIGFCFVISGLSVIIQVVYFKKTRKRFFLMAPFHHHLQQKGLTESKIAYLYSVITLVLTAFCLMPYLT